MLSIIIEPAKRVFKDPEKLCKKMKGDYLCKGVSMFDNLGKAMAYAMVCERLGGTVLVLDKGTDLGIFVGLVKDQRKLFNDILVRAVKYGAIYIPYPTVRLCLTLLFPSTQFMDKFLNNEKTVLLNYVEKKVSTSVRIVRMKDCRIIQTLIRRMKLDPMARSVLKKAFIDVQYIENLWSNFTTQCSSASS